MHPALSPPPSCLSANRSSESTAAGIPLGMIPSDDRVTEAGLDFPRTSMPMSQMHVHLTVS